MGELPARSAHAHALAGTADLYPTPNTHTGAAPHLPPNGDAGPKPVAHALPDAKTVSDIYAVSAATGGER